MSNSLLSLSVKTDFKGIYSKETKNGKAFIARYTINKKTKTQIIGYEKNGMTEYDAYKVKLNLMTDIKLSNAVNNNAQDNYLMPKLFLEFLEFKKPLLAKNTIDNYKSIYNQYIKVDYKNVDVRSTSMNDLQNYINSLLSYRRPATVEKILSAFKKFYLYLQDHGIYRYNPASNISMPKYDNKKYFSMSKADVKKLMSYIKKIDNHKYKTLYFLLLHGRRFNETITLMWTDIDFAGRIYHLKYNLTKTRNNQYYYLEEFQLEALLQLRKMYPNTKYVFENLKTKLPYTYTTIFRVHKKLRIDLNMPDFSIHSTRHLVAFLIINNGYSLEVCAKILGHKNIQSTQRYAVLEMNKARIAYKKTISAALMN